MNTELIQNLRVRPISKYIIIKVVINKSWILKYKILHNHSFKNWYLYLNSLPDNYESKCNGYFMNLGKLPDLSCPFSRASLGWKSNLILRKNDCFKFIY